MRSNHAQAIELVRQARQARINEDLNELSKLRATSFFDLAKEEQTHAILVAIDYLLAMNDDDKDIWPVDVTNHLLVNYPNTIQKGKLHRMVKDTVADLILTSA
jgi:hypothetical protein